MSVLRYSGGGTGVRNARWVITVTVFAVEFDIAEFGAANPDTAFDVKPDDTEPETAEPDTGAPAQSSAKT